METIDSHDLLVIGGGPAGLSAALESSKHGVKAAIIEERITLGGQIFKRLGVALKIRLLHPLARIMQEGQN